MFSDEFPIEKASNSAVFALKQRFKNADRGFRHSKSCAMCGGWKWRVAETHKKRAKMRSEMAKIGDSEFTL
jgi:hypothetical protein